LIGHDEEAQNADDADSPQAAAVPSERSPIDEAKANEFNVETFRWSQLDIDDELPRLPHSSQNATPSEPLSPSRNVNDMQDECTEVKGSESVEALLPRLPAAAKGHCDAAEHPLVRDESGSSPKRIGALADRPAYTLTVERKEGSTLGVSVDTESGTELVIKGISPGLLYDTIAHTGPVEWIRPDDTIVKVNGFSGDADEMMNICKRDKVLHITIQPPSREKDSEPGICISKNPEVYVNVYDLSRLTGLSKLNEVTTSFGLFHTSVEVFGREWYFSGAEGSLFHGVFSMNTPRDHPQHVYRRSVLMGKTGLTPADFEDLMPLVRIKWPHWSYHPFWHNCHHFTDFLCRTLGFAAAPKFGLFGSGDPELAKQESSRSSMMPSSIMDVLKVASCFPACDKSGPTPRTPSRGMGMPQKLCASVSWAGTDSEIVNPSSRGKPPGAGAEVTLGGSRSRKPFSRAV
jgi:hypothetical protein